MLATVSIRIDEAPNGVWLINYEKNHPHFDNPVSGMKSMDYGTNQHHVKLARHLPMKGVTALMI